MAIPPDELAQLGLDSCSNKDEQNKAPKQTRLFWGGEELVDVGGKRFYPKRQALLAPCQAPCMPLIEMEGMI